LPLYGRVRHPSAGLAVNLIARPNLLAADKLQKMIRITNDDKPYSVSRIAASLML